MTVITKRLYTSYFNYIKEHLELLKACYSIARFNPSWYAGGVIFELRPPVDLLYAYKTGTIKDSVYIYHYNQLLNELDAGDLLKKIPNEAILICYELPGMFCHRHLVADWLNKTGLVRIGEIDYGCKTIKYNSN